MKYFSILLFVVFISSCSKQTWEIAGNACTFQDDINADYSKAGQLQNLLDKYAGIGLPGIAIAVYSPEGFWAGSAGYAKLENKTLMQPCHLQYSQSVSKTYLAVAMLKLSEQGQINLDEKITAYLPAEVTKKVTGAEKVTVRQLMNHTSGIAEYNDKPAYVSYLLQHPLHVFTTMDYLDFIEGDDMQFEPGSKLRYTNTNYLLLALIGDQLTGDHAKYLRDQIFKPLGLVNSYYRDDENYLNQPDLVNSYWDRYSNSALENCSAMQKVNVGSLIGDDGIIAAPADYVSFLKALFEDQLLTPSSMDQMLTFVKNDTGQYAYGYGLGISNDPYKEHNVYGHSGGGIGAGCLLEYIPDKDTYFFIAINIGTIISSPVTEKAADIREEILEVILE